MLKRQDSTLSASRRQAAAAGATPPPAETHHAKAIGCMSGIFQLFSKYQNPNKRLTLGKKQEKKKQTKSANAAAPPVNSKSAAEEDRSEIGLACAIKAPRSPTLRPEIRRSNSPENSRTPPSSLVARLMGLESVGAAKRPGFLEDSVTEKRQRLLQALEKCNEDLEALRRIIKAVQTTDVRVQPAHSGDANAAVEPCVKKSAAEEEVRVPVEELTRSPLSSYSVQNTSPGAATRASQQRKPVAAKKPGEDDDAIARILSKPTITESPLVVRRQAVESPPWSSRAMVQSVEEVCRDIAWGERREIGRIGLVVQDYLCRELIEELVKELRSCSVARPLPLEACKRRLCF